MQVSVAITLFSIIQATFVVIGTPLYFPHPKKTQLGHALPSPLNPRTDAIRWIMGRVGKRGTMINKCEENVACAMLQVQPGTSSYWIEEICSCGQDSPCSTEWSDHNADGKSIDNADTQLKVTFLHLLLFLAVDG